jgi:hypothetical protein
VATQRLILAKDIHTVQRNIIIKTLRIYDCEILYQNDMIAGKLISCASHAIDPSQLTSNLILCVLCSRYHSPFLSLVECSNYLSPINIPNSGVTAVVPPNQTRKTASLPAGSPARRLSRKYVVTGGEAKRDPWPSLHFRALVNGPIKVCPERGALHRERHSVDVVISLSCNLETIVLLAAIAQLQLPIFFHVLSSSQAA